MPGQVQHRPLHPAGQHLRGLLQPLQGLRRPPHVQVYKCKFTLFCEYIFVISGQTASARAFSVVAFRYHLLCSFHLVTKYNAIFSQALMLEEQLYMDMVQIIGK